MVTDVSKEYIQGVTRRYATGIKVIVIIIIALLLAWVISKIVRSFKKPANADYVPGGGELPASWSPAPITKDIFNVIDGVLVSTDTMQDVFGRFNQLTDNQMIAVYNKWNDEGYDEVKKYFLYPLGSLTNAIKDKIGYWAFGMNQKDLAVQNLERLHLN